MRSGDETAFTELYARHHAVARRVASTYRRGADADDLVNEAFEKVLGALRRGHGPTDAFRAYLFVTLRRLAAENATRPADEPLDDLPDPVIAVAAAAEAVDPGDAEDRQMIVEAFGSLPERWQAVLWHTAVEGRKPSDLAPGLGMSPNAVSALAYRAREQLRQAYLQAHLQIVPRPQCEPHRSTLGAYVRDGLSRRERTATEAHLDRCATCHQLVGELTEVNQLLVRAFMPLFLAMPVQGIAASAAASALGGAAATSSLAGAAGAAGAAGSAAAPTARRLVGGWGWVRDVLHTAGGLAAATVVVAGLAAGTLAYRHNQRGEHVDLAADEKDATTLAPAAGTSTPTDPTPGTPGSCTVTPVAASTSTDAGGATSTTVASGSSTTLEAGVDELLTTLLGDDLVDLDVAAGTTSSTGSDTSGTATGASGESAAGVTTSAGPTPVGTTAQASSPVRLDAPRCTTGEDGNRELTVGVSNTAGPTTTGATGTTAADGTATDTSDPADLDVSVNALDTVTVDVELADGVTALGVDLPDGCQIDGSGSLVTCPLGTVLPGTGASATLDLGLDGDGGGATVTVHSGGVAVDVQTIDVLPSLNPTTP